MGMTITEKILARHTDLAEVSPGMLINARVDIALGNDITAPIAIAEFRKAGGTKVYDREKVVLVPDHFAPNKDIASAEQCRVMKEFAREQEITHYYEVGVAGIEHALLPEQGVVLPGDLVIGADSHSCTYGALGAFGAGVGSTDLAATFMTGETWMLVPESMKIVLHGKMKKWVSGKDLILYIIGKIGVDGALYRAMEFTGETIRDLTMADRFTMANMVIEAGAKNGIFIPDEITEEYVKTRAKRSYELLDSAPDAVYHSVLDIDVSRIEPQVAFPPLPSNTRGISQVGDIRLDQSVIGSCTNGRIEDLRIAAEILKGRKVAPHMRLIVIPATQEMFKAAVKEGLVGIFLEANAVVSTPTCGPCLGGYMGILADGEKTVSTTNRNFVGRMGHRNSEIYLASPAIAAASAVLGRIGSPEEL
ncbi:MAG: 3-isopropylmalate dehydratase large subunit [Deltaproteobacteria bacterium]|nr:3-isopropylmalate dehydratase large subunit [Deltaproteobacteria bacterium]